MDSSTKEVKKNPSKVKKNKNGNKKRFVPPARNRNPDAVTKYLIPKDDFRRVKVGSEIVALPGTKNSVVIDTQYDGETIIAMVWGYLSFALQRGYLSGAPDPSYPFWAGNYLVSLINNYLSGALQKNYQSSPLAIKGVPGFSS